MCWFALKEKKGVSAMAALLSLLLCSVFVMRTGAAVECHCSECAGPAKPGHFWPTCSTEGACYIRTLQLVGNSEVMRVRGCFPEKNLASSCAAAGTTCCHGDRCNGNLVLGHSRKLLQDMTESVADGMEGMSEGEQTIAIITASVCVVLITGVVSLVVTLTICCLYFNRGNHRTHAHSSNADVEARAVVIGNCCSAIVPQGVTISSLLNSLQSHANPAPSPSLSLLVQRAIVKSTRLEHLVERGRFCESHVGRWRGERVMVKIYPQKQSKIWFSETEIHQIPHMQHPQVVTFIAADYLQRHQQLRHYLITEHHERGSLDQHLRASSLDVAALVVLAQSAASGLAHLHHALHAAAAGGSTVEKPSLVHRNVASKSFYVKNDGTCCLGDMSLAVKESANFLEEVKGKALGHTLYLSPEVLEWWMAREPMSCDVWKKADVYALGLVIWEIARRCLIQGCVESAEFPFTALASSADVSLEEMRQLVCCKRLRPTIAPHWSRDEVMESCVQVMRECWHHIPSCRPSAMSVKNSLDKLLPAIKLSHTKTSK